MANRLLNNFKHHNPFVNVEEQEDKRATFEVLRELCSGTRRERMEVARCVERKLERDNRIVDLFSEALDLFGDRALLLEALFPPHFKDFCLVAFNLLHFQLRVQHCDSIYSSVTEISQQSTIGKFQWYLLPHRPHNLNERDARNDDWNNVAAGLNYWGPLPFKKWQPPAGEPHARDSDYSRCGRWTQGREAEMLKKFRVRPAHDHDGNIILDSSRVQQQADLQCPTAEPFDMQEGIDCLIHIRVIESRRNFTDFKFDEKGEGTTSSATSSAAVAVAPEATGVLNVNGTRLYVSKEFLCLVSPFFKKLFTQEFAEKGLNEEKLHGKKAAEVEDFLLVVSSRLSAKPVHPNPQNMAALLELADYFDVPFHSQELGHLFPVFAEIPLYIRLTLAVRYRLTEVKDSLIDSEFSEESARLCQRLLLPKLGGQKERELVLDGYLQGKSNKAILKEMLASCISEIEN